MHLARDPPPLGLARLLDVRALLGLELPRALVRGLRSRSRCVRANSPHGITSSVNSAASRTSKTYGISGSS